MGSSRHTTLRHALKEWAVAVRALERGETALVIRKGGIREKAFAVPRRRFDVTRTRDTFVFSLRTTPAAIQPLAPTGTEAG